MQQDAANNLQHQEIQESDVQKWKKNVQANQAKNAPELPALSFALFNTMWALLLLTIFCKKESAYASSSRRGLMIMTSELRKVSPYLIFLQQCDLGNIGSCTGLSC